MLKSHENSIPVKKELEGSPLLGTWRTDRIESEWGPLILELRFKLNGVVYQVMLSAEPEPGAEQQEGFTVDGIFSVKENQLEITLRKRTTEQKFGIENNVLTLESDGNKISYKKFNE